MLCEIPFQSENLPENQMMHRLNEMKYDLQKRNTVY